MPINYEYNNITGSGSLFINNSGNFVSGLYVNSVPVSLSGHTHNISDITNFGSGVSGLLPSNLVYTTGNQNISGVKTFTTSVSAPTGDWNYLVSTGNILTNFVTPTNIKFKYDNMGIDDITTVDELLKRLVDKTLYTQVSASVTNNRGTSIQPGTTVSSATYTVSTNAGVLSTGYISGTSIPTTYISTVGSYSINFTSPLNSGQNQSYTYTLAYNDTKRTAGGSALLTTTTSMRFIDYKYYGVSLSGNLQNSNTQTNLQNAFSNGYYGSVQDTNRSLTYTFNTPNTNGNYYYWYIMPSGGISPGAFTLSNNFIASSQVKMDGLGSSAWEYIGAFNIINQQNYSHPYYFYRYQTVQVANISTLASFS